MPGRILDGKHIATELIDAIKDVVRQRRADRLRPPGLAMVLVGDDPASGVYVRNKERACERCGFHSVLKQLAADTSEMQLLDTVDVLNRDPAIHGILVQLPLPAQIDANTVVGRIDPAKDADGFHPINMGRLALGLDGLRPCTPRGIMTLLKQTGIDPDGKDALVIGRSNIVGRPMALELLRANATVTVSHSHTRELAEKARSADILVAAIGRPRLVSGDWIKPGAVVIDVGMNRMDNGTLVGDVDFEAARERAEWITPVPGGVGPMTVASLLQNTLDAAQALDP